MYDKEARVKAADEAMRLGSERSPIRLGDPFKPETAFYANVGCNEVVYEALEKFLPLKVPRLLDYVIGYGRGYSGMGEVCGAVSGAILAFGVDLADKFRDTVLLRLFVGRATQKFILEFRKEFGSCLCRDIMPGYDISGALRSGDRAYEAWLRSGTVRQPKKCADAMRFAIMYPLPSEEGLEEFYHSSRDPASTLTTENKQI